MAETGGQPGNTNGAKGREWRDAIRYALAKKGRGLDGDEAAYRKGLNAVAEKFVEAAAKGEAWAMKELGDRTDGKAIQAIEMSTPDGPIGVVYKMEFPEHGDDPAADAT